MTMRMGVIGTGSMGKNHARIYAEMGVLAGIYDVNDKAAKEIADKYGIEHHNSVESLLKAVDGVSISTPTNTHHEMALKSISYGTNLLIEKPFTGDVNAAAEICELAEKESLVLSAGMVERFNPVVSEAKKQLDNGRFGELITISSRRVSSMPYRIRDVGVILDLGIHDVDALVYLAGSKAKSVYCVGGSFNGNTFEDHASIVMVLENGKSAHVEVNWLTPMKVRSVYMTCSKMYATIDYMSQMISTSTSRFVGNADAPGFESPWEFDSRETFLSKEEPLKRELENFMASIKGEARALVSGWDAVEDLKVCHAALRSMRENRVIEI
ncbi:MAG: UDP-N-acetylglucosamine 3-dehydrogenase [Candidatus Methanomethylophilaceae archaeon]|nr:UDP-N-acetylglucosamine 3-dehydrogenase [Candidatus Methanomethylophilaceae archaeon]